MDARVQVGAVERFTLQGRDPLRRQVGVRRAHLAEVELVYDRMLSESTLRSRYVQVGTGRQVHLLERDGGIPVMLLHGTGSQQDSFCPC